MVRAVLDVNVFVSGLLAPRGVPAEVLRREALGAFDLVVSAILVAELEATFAKRKLRRIPSDVTFDLLARLRSADLRPDSRDVRGPLPADPDDVYLVALARAEGAYLVSGDRHLLDLAPRLPVLAPRAFLALLERT